VSSADERLARRRPRRNPLWRPLAAVVGGVLVLLLGIAIGRALEDGPAPGGTRTSVRTLEPQPLPPAAKTVTVTVGNG
jgi:hypothetical protein